MATFNVTSQPRLARGPRDDITSLICRPDFHGATRKAVAEDIRNVLPDLVAVEIVREDGLADVGLEDAALDGGHLEGGAVRYGIAAKVFSVKSVFGDDLLGSYAGADGPEIDGVVALVCDNRTTNDLRASSEAEKGESNILKEHVEILLMPT